MVKRFCRYLAMVLILGLPIGAFRFAEAGFEDSLQSFGLAVLYTTMYLGPLFAAIEVSLLSLSTDKTALILICVSLLAAVLVTTVFYYAGPDEVRQNILAGWGDDVSTYKTYPIKGYQLVGPLVFVLYIVAGASIWIALLIEAKKAKQ